MCAPATHPGVKREREPPAPLRPPPSAGGRAPGTPYWLPRDYELCRASPGPAPRPLRVGGAWRGAPPAERPSPGSRAVSASPRRAARASLTYAGADEPPLSTLAPEAAPLSLASAAPVPDGRRSLASEAKRLDNARRAHESGLAAPQRGFFQQGILRDGAPQSEHDVALSLLRSAEERAARANHGSKDKRLGTSLSKYELLLRALPAMRPFEPLRFEGDLQTSERNEVLLVAIAEFIRRNPKATGGLVRADSVSGQVSGVKAIVEEHLGRKVLAPSGGRVLARELQQMRLEDGPSADRALSLPLRSDHLDRLADESSGFDVRSPGWPTARYALLRAMHQALMRGGEPGTLPGEPFRPALGVCWGDFTWHDCETGDLLTQVHPVTGELHWALILALRAIKDTKGTHRKVPTTIASRLPVSATAARDVTCPYFAILRLWEQRATLVPEAYRATAPFFVGPDGVAPVDTNVVHRVVVDAATALGLDASLFGSSACRRGGATDLRDKLGSAAGKQIIVQRGRWCHTDIDEIYSRASLGEHVAASVALSAPGGARSLEQVVPGWVQPARFRR